MMQLFRPPLLFPAVLVLLHQLAPADGGHVLVFPGEYSHWLNMRNILDELVRRNHSVTVLISEASPSVDYNNSQYAAKFNFLVYKVPFSKSELHGFTEELIHFSIFEWHRSSMLKKVLWSHDWATRSMDLIIRQCDSMFKNEQLMATLRDSEFDAVLVDPMMICGDLVADILDLPLIISMRLSFGGVMERHCGHAVAPPSYVPAAPLPYSDHMTFVERLINTVMYVSLSVMTEALWRIKLDKYYTEIKGSPTSYCGTLGKADLWFIRTFWDIETPKPIPPNFKYVGGLHCKPANQLPADMEEFVQSSGDAGVVVVSFGSMVNNFTTETADVIAVALGQIPQKVIWKYKGITPKTLMSNTKLYDWIPQNDLLGHPRTRAFVTHGGTNGLYEAVYHAVPLVGIPLFADQPDNVARLSRRGAAVVLDFNSMTSDMLRQALHDVINQPGYKSSIQHLSNVHRDQPVAPLSTAAFWVEFVMRHGGAPHLRLASRDLNWFQYHSLDVAAVLLVVLMITGALCWAGVRCFLLRCRRGRREKND
ncbi:UDP-glucuronosyltransferase 2A1 [Hippoglossus stenolepis]|uniref:UDP-glucuronosyltransferase 2A1 n=1 Tax=Hippoglossus stenolepis TaxID=195615 RepID=UPI001FAFE62D|nr:UDP-glucuronosyltransferase 2A1 [Hippoglossus stenolepis]